MTELKKSIAQGFGDGSELYGYLNDVTVAKSAGKAFVSSSGGTITWTTSAPPSVTPAAGDILILTTGTSTDTPKGAALVMGIGSDSTTARVAASAALSSAIFEAAAVAGYLVRFSIWPTD